MSCPLELIGQQRSYLKPSHPGRDPAAQPPACPLPLLQPSQRGPEPPESFPAPGPLLTLFLSAWNAPLYLSARLYHPSPPGHLNTTYSQRPTLTGLPTYITSLCPLSKYPGCAFKLFSHVVLRTDPSPHACQAGVLPLSTTPALGTSSS